MADRELLLEDLLGFMDDDEHARWDSARETERAEMRRELMLNVVSEVGSHVAALHEPSTIERIEVKHSFPNRL